MWSAVTASLLPVKAWILEGGVGVSLDQVATRENRTTALLFRKALLGHAEIIVPHISIITPHSLKS